MHDETSAVGMKEQRSFQAGNSPETPDVFEPAMHTSPCPTSAVTLFVKRIKTAKNDEIVFIRPEKLHMFTDQMGRVNAYFGPTDAVASISGILDEKHPMTPTRYMELFKTWFEDNFCTNLLKTTYEPYKQWLDHVQWHPRPVIDDDSAQWIAHCPSCDGNRYLRSRMVEFGVPHNMQYDKCKECNGTGVVARKNLKIIAKHLHALGKDFIIKTGVE